MKKVLVFLITSIILAGCSPSQEDIEKAISQTQAAMPTATATTTATPEPTNTPEPTKTATPKPTATEETYSAAQYLELVRDHVIYFCDSDQEIDKCDVDIKYIDTEKKIVVETQSDDVEDAFKIGVPMLLVSLQKTNDQYKKTVDFDPVKIEIYFSDGVNEENSFAEWSSIENYMNGITDYSVPIFELITNRYLGK